MYKKLVIIFLFLSFTNSNAADISNILSNLIPGEGLTEASIQINEDDNPDLEILAVRDINKTNKSNLLLNLAFTPKRLIITIDLLVI